MSRLFKGRFFFVLEQNFNFRFYSVIDVCWDKTYCIFFAFFYKKGVLSKSEFYCLFCEGEYFKNIYHIEEPLKLIRKRELYSIYAPLNIYLF